MEHLRVLLRRAEDPVALPTTLFHTAAADPIVYASRAYARGLADAGVVVRHREHTALVHHCHALNGFVPAAQVPLDVIAGYVADVLA